MKEVGQPGNQAGARAVMVRKLGLAHVGCGGTLVTLPNSSRIRTSLLEMKIVSGFHGRSRLQHRVLCSWPKVSNLPSSPMDSRRRGLCLYNGNAFGGEAVCLLLDVPPLHLRHLSFLAKSQYSPPRLKRPYTTAESGRWCTRSFVSVALANFLWMVVLQNQETQAGSCDEVKDKSKVAGIVP